MTTKTTRTTKSDPDRIRYESLRITAKRRGLNLQRDRKTGRWWIVRDTPRPDGGYLREIAAGGAQGLTIDQAERLIRQEGFGRETPAMAS